MGCGVSSKPKAPPNRARRPINLDPTLSQRQLLEQNGSIFPRERRLSLVSEGSEDELRSTELLQGNITMVTDQLNNKMVRIFASSTGTDTQHERNALIQRVYPRMKTYCSELGLAFHVVDMKWGAPREDTDNEHSTTQLSLKQLQTCQKLSLGPNFVTFLSEKYGHCPLPRTIPADQYELLLSGTKESESKKLLRKWYWLDKNAVPSEYVLQPISKILTGFLDKDPKAAKRSRENWLTEHEIMQTALAKAANYTLKDSSEAQKYVQSAAEKEIKMGILEAENPDAHCLWFHRSILDIDDQRSDKLLSTYTDCHGSEYYINESRGLLEHLKMVTLPKRIDRDNIINYHVPWTQSGIDPVNCRRHAEYIDQLCSDFEFIVKGQIRAAVEERESCLPVDALTEEVSWHAIYCQSKIDHFYGRQNLLDQLEIYLTGSSRYPYVIHGASGSGKTSIMAVAAQRAWQLYSGKAIVIHRFIGMTPDSSNVRTLLYSIVAQMRRLFQDEKPVPKDMKSLSDEFYTVLHLASAEQPIILVLDSLDQFTPDYSGRQLFWLPSKLPKHVKMLLSTLPEAQYECLPRLKMMLREDRHFLSVPRLNVPDVKSILTRWLEKRSRTLQSQQVDMLVGIFSQCPLPLYLRLCFDEACRWASYQKSDEIHLQDTIQSAIAAVFQRTEMKYGQVFVSRALSYMTLSRNGLSEGELEDILSCDDDVLSEVYHNRSPPVRRLPSVLLIRLQDDLQHYIGDRGADLTTVKYWCHRLFREEATCRYCSDNDTRKMLHSNIADYFRGVWSEKPKPYIHHKSGNQEVALRYVAKQPFMFEDMYNLRKLMELPTHIVQARLLTVFKDEILCNLQWLTHKIQASSLRHVLDDCSMARLVFPEDEDIKNMTEVLQLSQTALQMDPLQLPGQLLGRISQGNNKLMAQCCRPPYPSLIPSEVILTSPGGQLMYVLSEHSDEVNALDLTRDGKMAITCSDDHTVKLWDVEAGRLYKSIENVGDQPVFIMFCCNDTRAVVLDSKHLYLINLETSDIKVIDEPSLGITGDKVHRFLVFKNQSLLAVPVEQSIYIMTLPLGKVQCTIKDELLGSDVYGFGDILVGHQNILAITSTGTDIQYKVHLVNVQSKKVTHAVKVFEKPKNQVEEELTVDALVMTKDESMIIASEMLNNNLYFISVSEGQIVRRLEGNKEDSVDLFHITDNGRYLYFCNINHLCLWNLETGERQYTLHHVSRAQDVQTRNGQTYVSISGDHVCIWDITRSNGPCVSREEDGAHKVSEIFLLPQTDRYVVVVKKSTLKVDLQILVIYDVLQEKAIRTVKVQLDGEVKCVTDDERIILKHGRKAVVLNPRNHNYTVCQGMLSKYNHQICPLKRKSWFITLSRGRRKLKFYNWITGKVDLIIRADIKLESFTNDPFGKVAVAKSDNEGPILVFDINRRSLIHKLFFREEIYIINELTVTEDAQYLCLEVSREPEDEDISKTINYIIVYEVNTGTLKHHLADWEAFKVVENEHSDTDLDISNYMVLHNRQVLTSHYDNHMRFWDIHTGKLIDDIHLQEGDVSSLGMTLSPDGSRLVTLGSQGQMSVWDTQNRQRVASLTADNLSLFKPMVALGDASLILINSSVNERLTQLRLVGGGSKPRRDQRRLRETYIPNSKLDGDLITLPDNAEDEDDPDTDLDDHSLSDSDSERDYDEEEEDFFIASHTVAALSQDAKLKIMAWQDTHSNRARVENDILIWESDLDD